MNTHSQQPNCDITSHSRRQMNLDVQVQLDANLQAALVALGILLLLHLVKCLAGTDGWDASSSGNACCWTTSGDDGIVVSATWQTTLGVVCEVVTGIVLVSMSRGR